MVAVKARISTAAGVTEELPTTRMRIGCCARASRMLEKAAPRWTHCSWSHRHRSSGPLRRPICKSAQSSTQMHYIRIASSCRSGNTVLAATKERTNAR